ncbi:MAG: hypothetical protein M0005_03270 [Actinomycetota bacterium]|nr:hypothetical protein [Actinomycetota bacterium]
MFQLTRDPVGTGLVCCNAPPVSSELRVSGGDARTATGSCAAGQLGGHGPDLSTRAAHLASGTTSADCVETGDPPTAGGGAGGHCRRGLRCPRLSRACHGGAGQDERTRG